MVRRQLKLACVSMKDACKIMDVSIEVVKAYVKQGDLQWIPMGPHKMIPLYEVASLRDITLQKAIDLTCIYHAVICYIWMEEEATSTPTV